MGSHVMMYGFKELTEEPVADYIATLSVDLDHLDKYWSHHPHEEPAPWR